MSTSYNIWVYARRTMSLISQQKLLLFMVVILALMVHWSTADNPNVRLPSRFGKRTSKLLDGYVPDNSWEDFLGRILSKAMARESFATYRPCHPELRLTKRTTWTTNPATTEILLRNFVFPIFQKNH